MAGREEIAGEAPHALDEIAKVIFVRIDSPDDVAHRIYQVARGAGDRVERLADWRFLAYLMTRHFTENRDSCQARTNIVMEV